MVVIRLRRAGSKKRPFFRVVVTDSRAARDSSFVEVLGFYNPRTTPETLNLKRDRVEHWLAAWEPDADLGLPAGSNAATSTSQNSRLANPGTTAPC